MKSTDPGLGSEIIPPGLEVTEADSQVVEARQAFPRSWPDGTQAGASWSYAGRHGQPHESLHLVVGAKVQDCAVEFGCQVVADADHDRFMARPVEGITVGPSRVAEHAAEGFLWFRPREVQPLLATASASLIAMQQPAEHLDHFHCIPGHSEVSMSGDARRQTLTRYQGCHWGDCFIDVRRAWTIQRQPCFHPRGS